MPNFFPAIHFSSLSGVPLYGRGETHVLVCCFVFLIVVNALLCGALMLNNVFWLLVLIVVAMYDITHLQMTS